MLQKLKAAIPERANHCAALEELEEGLEAEHADELKEWRAQLLDWKKDHANPNPYEWRGTSMLLYILGAWTVLSLQSNHTTSAKRPFSVTVCGDFLYFSGLLCLFRSTATC